MKEERGTNHLSSLQQLRDFFFFLLSLGNSDLINMWQVEKLDSRGLTIATGCIPISVE